MPRICGFQSFLIARRTIQGFEAMLWLRKGFGFAGAWSVRERNWLLVLQLRVGIDVLHGVGAVRGG